MKKRYISLIVIFCAAALMAAYLLRSTPSHKKPVGKPDTNRFKRYVVNDTDKLFLQAYEQVLNQEFSETNTPGASVAIVKEGEVIFSKSFGVKAAGGTDSVNTKTLFRIASVSKGFSAVLAGLIADDSLITWNDSISSFINYPLTGIARDITVKHILSHTAGFPYQAYSTLVEDELPRDTMIHRLLEIPLPRVPGEIHSYQNVAYSIIENVLEKTTGKTFPELMQERIFDPLEMDDASMSYDSMMANDNKAMPHGYRYKNYIPTEVRRSYYNVASAGGLNLNIEDLARWLSAMLGNEPEVISEDLLEQVFTPVIQIRVKNPYFSRFDKPRKGYYGLGWRIMEYPNDTLVYHGGYANGYKSGIAFDKNKNIGVCVLTNAPSKFSNLAMIKFFEMYKEYFKEEESLDIKNAEF